MRSSVFDLAFGVVVGPVGERKLGQVPSQANPAGNHDVGIGTAPAQPLAAGVRQAVNVQDRFPPSSPRSRLQTVARSRPLNRGRIRSPEQRLARAGSRRRMLAGQPSRCATSDSNSFSRDWISSRIRAAVSYSSSSMADPQLAPQLDELVLELAGVRRPLGKLAGVLSFVVDVFQQRLQLLGKRDVIVRATEPSLAAKLAKGDSAVGANEMIDIPRSRSRPLFARLARSVRRSRPAPG